jgi:2-oxoisovalerate dehydrogenase E1 component
MMAARVAPHVDRELLLDTMLLIRRFEERVLALFAEGRLSGTTHPSIGQEANAVAVLAAAEPTDIVVSNHRGHAHFIAHTDDVEGLAAELLGRSTGVSGGIGGSQHLHRRDGFFSNGVQGGVVPFAVGLAEAERRLERGTVVICYIGDGTMGAGVVYEAFNFATLWRAPILFVLEHNGIAQTTPTELVQVGDFCERARGFGLHTSEVAYPAVEELYEHAQIAIRRCRAGQPGLLLVRSVRLAAHSKGDETRSPEIMEGERARDPLARLVTEFSAARVAMGRRNADLRVEAAFSGAASAAPPEAPSTRAEAVDAGTRFRCADLELSRISGRSVAEQLNLALHRLFETRPSVVLLGQDVLDPYGGAFKITRGLSERHPGRVLATPISESGTIGVAGGMAVRGLRPIVEVMFGDFLALCADQIINHVTKWPLMFEGVKCPVVIRSPMGGRRGYGPTHSQTLERLFLGTPGLKVVAPSHVHDSGACLDAAVEDGGPVLFIENKDLYGRRIVFESGRVDDFEVRYLGEGAPLACLSLTGFEDEDVTLYAYGGMAPHAMQAARRLLVEYEVSVRLVLPAQLFPMPRALLAAAWVEDSAVLTVDESTADFGFGAEVLASLVERGCRPRKSARVGARGAVIAASRSTENETLPQASDIVENSLALVRS